MSGLLRTEGVGAWVLDRLGAGARTPRVRDGPPEVEVRTGPTVPAVVLRVVLALAGVGAVLVAQGAPGAAPGTGGLVVLLAVGVAPAVVPRLPSAAVLLLLLGAWLVVHDPAPPLVLAGLVLLVHVVLRLAPVVALTGWRSRVEVAVLRTDLRAALAAQAGAQALALVAGAVAGSGGGSGWRVAGLVVVLVLTSLALARPERPWWRAQP